MPSPSSLPQRVLWIRIGAVGDLMVATAALVETLERFPNAQVWVVGPAFWRELLIPSHWPRVTGLLELNPKTLCAQFFQPDSTCEEWVSKGSSQPLLQWARQCQISVNLRPESLRFAWLLWKARIPVRLGTCPWFLKTLVTHWDPWLGRDPILHERDRMLRIASAQPRAWWPLGWVSSNRRALKREQTALNPAQEKADKWHAIQPAQDPQSVAARWRTRVLPSLKKLDEDTATALTGCQLRGYVLINPTSSRREKAWSAERFRELCLRLKPFADQHGFKIIIMGAPKETPWLKEVAGEEFVIVQPERLRQVMDVIGCARALITTASSLQFFANAFGTPAFVLLGRTFAARWGPLGGNDRALHGSVDDSITDIFAQEVQAFATLRVDSVEKEIRAWLANFFNAQNRNDLSFPIPSGPA